MRKYYPFPNRDDIQWGLLTASVINQWSEDKVRVTEVMPYNDPFEDITLDELKLRIGL